MCPSLGPEHPLYAPLLHVDESDNGLNSNSQWDWSESECQTKILKALTSHCSRDQQVLAADNSRYGCFTVYIRSESTIRTDYAHTMSLISRIGTIALADRYPFSVKNILVIINCKWTRCIGFVYAVQKHRVVGRGKFCSPVTSCFPPRGRSSLDHVSYRPACASCAWRNLPRSRRSRSRGSACIIVPECMPRILPQPSPAHGVDAAYCKVT